MKNKDYLTGMRDVEHLLNTSIYKRVHTHNTRNRVGSEYNSSSIDKITSDRFSRVCVRIYILYTHTSLLS